MNHDYEAPPASRLLPRVLMVLVVAAMAAALVAASGAAWAATIQCTGGDCPGTEQPDVINGSDTRDVIDALDGQSQDGQVDYVSCGPGTDTVEFDEGIDYVSPDCENRNPQE